MNIVCGPKRQGRISIYESASQLPAGWDRLLPEGHALQSSQLRLYESAGLPDITHFYAIAGTEQQPVAIACFQVLQIRNYHINYSQLGSIRAGGIQLLLSVIRPRLLVAGHLFRHDITAFYAPSLGNMDAYRIYESMTAMVLKKSCAMAALIKDMPPQLVDYFRNFARQYQFLPNDINMEMQLPGHWSCFTDYEHALKHKYAQKLRKVRQALSGVEIRELTPAEVRAQKENIYRLYRQVSDKQSLSLGFLNADFLPLLKEAYDEQLKIWGFYEQGIMVAFASAWVRDQSFDMFYIGFDYARNTSLQLYFNILYFSIEQAILLRKPRLILGRTALEAKARLGCTPHYLYTFLLVRNPYLRRLVAGQMRDQYRQEGAWEERHPFK